MKGLEIARGYYEEFGKPMLKTEFSDILPYIAVGFVGSGSEHYGFDDDISRDHDFEPGFCIFLPGEDIVDRRRAFLLERAYAKLPKEYAGVKRQNIAPVGGNRNGVLRTGEFYLKSVGAPDGKLTDSQWLRIPDYALAEAVNGEVFLDNYGEFTKIRQHLLNMPEDIRLKRIAGNLLVMAQSGQYNFLRCVKHGEPQAAQFAAVEFTKAAMKVFFLLHNRYMPYYKWSFRALSGIADVKDLCEKLSFLMFGDNRNQDICKQKYDVIEEISSRTVQLLKDRKITDATYGDLEKHAYGVNNKIVDPGIRNMNIFIAVGD